MKITIPFKTPSVNHLYFNWQNRKILTKEAREICLKINEICKKQLNEITWDKLTTKLSVDVLVYENWFYKNGNVSRKDIANREKFLIDSVFKSLEIDDKMIFKHTMIKINVSVGELTEIIISPLI